MIVFRESVVKIAQQRPVSDVGTEGSEPTKLDAVSRQTSIVLVNVFGAADTERWLGAA